MLDPYGRRITYLRMSVTDQCNFHCVYCTPNSARSTTNCTKPPTLEELSRIGRFFIDEGIRRIRLTGGEPLLREDLPSLVADLRDADSLEEICLTTNGCYLAERIQELAKAGLQSVNISIDSLVPERYEELTGGGKLGRVVEALQMAAEILPKPPRINIVVIKEINDDEILTFAELTRSHNYDVCFIEPMPTYLALPGNAEKVVPISAMRQRISEAFPLEKIEKKTPHKGPCAIYHIPSAGGTIGFIGAVSEPFCRRCNRIRITPDGKLRGCLFSDEEIDLLAPIRNGASDEDLHEIVGTVLSQKPEQHSLGSSEYAAPRRTMCQIGG